MDGINKSVYFRIWDDTAQTVYVSSFTPAAELFVGSCALTLSGIAAYENEFYGYDGIIDEAKWLEVSMDVHFGCLFFFVNLLMDLLNYTLNSTIAMADIPVKLKPILARSGKVMQQLLNSRMEILKK